jgi:hypothetical protein
VSRHSRTSPASSVLKLCKDTERTLDNEDMNRLRSLINDYPGISEQEKGTICDLVTIVVFKHENYRKALGNLETFLDSLEM